jgi:hypothetical protein
MEKKKCPECESENFFEALPESGGVGVRKCPECESTNFLCLTFVESCIDCGYEMRFPMCAQEPEVRNLYTP